MKILLLSDVHLRTKKIFHSILRFDVLKHNGRGGPIKYRIKYYYVNRNVINVNDVISIANGTLEGFSKKTFILKISISIRKK